MIKAQLRKIARVIAGWPLIGRFVRIGVAIIRLPESRDANIEMNRRQLMFEAQQLPTILATISDLNHRQLNDQNNNFVKSVPVALRKLTRDLIDIRRQQENTLNSVDYLLGRVEFVRREIMFEMRYGASTQSGKGDRIMAKTEILSPEKLAIARKEGLRLNLGCGHVPLEGYLNVDRRALPGVDIVAEIDDLPFEPNEVDEIFSAHLLEHFPQEQLIRVLLPYFFSLLKNGGIFHAVVPDSQAMIKNYSNGSYSYGNLREVIFGAQDYDGDFHFNMFTPESLTEILLKAGFKAIEVIDSARVNGACYEFEIAGKK